MKFVCFNFNNAVKKNSKDVHPVVKPIHEEFEMHIELNILLNKQKSHLRKIIFSLLIKISLVNATKILYFMDI